MAKSPEEMEAVMVQNLADRTGKALADWLNLVRASGHTRHGEIVKFLKVEHGMGHGYANLVAHRALAPTGTSSPTGSDLVDAQYAGAKAALRPILEAVLLLVRQFGSDVEVSPKKTCVSLRRRKQFALIQPSTATRLDVGINLKGVACTVRLEPAGSFSSMVSHRVRLTGLKDVDAELEGWLRSAYEAS